MARLKLPPGFRFHPTDVELMTYYLKRKVYGREIEYDIVAEVDLYKCEPWDLPDKSLITSSDSEWYFFSAPDKKYSNGSRTNRATEAGYWKATGKDRVVKTSKGKVGMKKTLVFYKGRAPRGERTNWVMHEYRLEEDDPQKIKNQDAFVLCRIFKKSGIGPKNPEYNSASLDLDDEADTITQGETMPDEKLPASDETSSACALTDEGALTVGSEGFNHTETIMDSERKTEMENKTAISIPGDSLDAHKPNDFELSVLYGLLCGSPNPSADAVTMANESASELARLDSLSTIENPSSIRTAQDIDMWLQEPSSTDIIDANASASAVQRYSTAGNIFKKSDAPEQQFTQQQQELQAATVYLENNAFESEYLLQEPMPLNFNYDYVHDWRDTEGCVVKKDLSSMSELESLEAAQVPSAEVLNRSEEVPEEDVLEELLQLITEGQRSASTNAQTPQEGVTGGVEDVYFDVEELDMDEWLDPSWNETSTSQLPFVNSLGPSSGQYESGFTMPVDSASNPYHLSQGLSGFSNSSLSMQTLQSSFEEQGQGQAESHKDTRHMISSSADLTSRKGNVSHEERSSSKSSKPLSRFSKLLDSLPASPALAAEFPFNRREHRIVSKNLLETDSGPRSKTTRMAACYITFRCGFEFLSGVWRSSAVEQFKKPIVVSKNEAKASTIGPGYDIEISERKAGERCFARCGSGCFLLIFCLGAFSAVCWFFLLRIFWRLASHMGALLT